MLEVGQMNVSEWGEISQGIVPLLAYKLCKTLSSAPPNPGGRRRTWFRMTSEEIDLKYRLRIR